MSCQLNAETNKRLGTPRWGRPIKWMSKPNFFISTDVLGSEELKEEIISLKMDHRQDGSTFFVTTSEHDDFTMSLALGLSHLESKNRCRGGMTDYFFSNVA